MHCDTVPPAAYEIAGKRWQRDAPGISEAIAYAFEHRLRPRCLCRENPDGQGIEMYVARLMDGYIVKRMPNTGSQHDINCMSYELSSHLTGLEQLLGRAIVEDPATGETTLKLDFPLTKMPGSSRIPPAVNASESNASDDTRLSLRDLLHYLWDQAELTHWHPGFTGKRSWGTVRRHLIQAAEHKCAKGYPLASRLYIPEVFTVENRVSINTRRLAQWARAVAHPGRVNPMMLMIAEVKGIMPARCGQKVVLKHVPDQHVMLGDEIFRRLERCYANELALWASSDDIRLVMIATSVVTTTGLPRIESISLLTLTAEWIPVADAYEIHLLRALVSERRSFVKMLRYNLRTGADIPCAVLTDSGDAVELHIVDESTSRALKNQEGETSPSSRIGQWVWNPDHEQQPQFPVKSKGLPQK